MAGSIEKILEVAGIEPGTCQSRGNSDNHLTTSTAPNKKTVSVYLREKSCQRKATLIGFYLPRHSINFDHIPHMGDERGTL